MEIKIVSLIVALSVITWLIARVVATLQERK